MEINGVSSKVDSVNFGNKYANGMHIGKDKTISNVEERKYTEKELINAIESANEEIIVYGKRFEFSIHEETKHIVVKVIDVATEEVIREIPPEKILDLIASLWEISGLIVDERV